MSVSSIVIPRAQAGQTVGAVLHETLRLGRSVVLQHLRDKKVRLAGHLCQAIGRRVRSGQRLEIMLTDPKVPEKRRPRGVSKRTKSASPALPRSPLAQAIRVRYL